MLLPKYFIAGLTIFLVSLFAVPPVHATGERIIFLHHSTGAGVWSEGNVASWISNYNSAHGTGYSAVERAYPNSPYPWANYAYDYWNLWVNNQCDSGQSNIECMNTLAASYDVVIFKHCYPGADILEDTGSPDISSSRKSLENYKLQYRALRTLMDTYSDTLFIVWTLAPRHRLATNAGNRARSKQFVDWVKGSFLTEDGKQHPNIKIFDFFGYTAEQSASPAQGEQYALKYAYEKSHTSSDSHPNTTANQAVGPIFGQFIVDSISDFNAGGGGERPSVSAVCPARGESAAPTDTRIKAVFDRAMDASTLTTSTVTVTGSGSVSGSTAYDAGTNTLSFTPVGSLSGSTTYTVTIAAGVTDDNGMEMGTAYSWSFTTGAGADSEPPAVTATDPVDGGTDVYLNPVIEARFNDHLDPTMNSGLLTLKHTESGASVSGQYVLDAAAGAVRFVPASNLESDANYTATVSGDACDLAGNTMGSSYEWAFVTGKTVNIPALSGLGGVILPALLAMGGGFGLRRRKRRNAPCLDSSTVSANISKS